MLNTVCSFGQQKSCHKSTLPSISPVPHVALRSSWLPPTSQRCFVSFDKSEGGDDQTSVSTPVNLDRTNQPCNLLGWFLHCLAHHPGTFSIVWPLTELLFFSLVSPRDPKWDIDILARPVLGLAFDAPECSA